MIEISTGIPALLKYVSFLKSEDQYQDATPLEASSPELLMKCFIRAYVNEG